MILSTALLSKTNNFLRFESRSIEQEMAIHIAEAGIDYAAFKFRTDDAWPGVSSFALGEGEFEVSVSPKVINNITVQVAAYVPSKATPRAKRFVSMDFVQGEIIYNAWPYALATLTGDLNINTDITVEGGTTAPIWSSEDITGTNLPNDVPGECKYDDTKNALITCDLDTNVVGDYQPQLNWDQPYKNCTTFYLYWEISASGDTSLDPESNCNPPPESNSKTIDCNIYNDGLTGDNHCNFSDPNLIKDDPQWSCTGNPPDTIICRMPNRRFLGNLTLSSPVRWEIEGTVYVKQNVTPGDFRLSFGTVIELTPDAITNGYGVVIVADGKMNVGSNPTAASTYDCVRRQGVGAEKLYLWLITRSSDIAAALTLNCKVIGVLTVPNGGLYFEWNSQHDNPRLQGAALAKYMAQGTDSRLQEMIYDYGLNDGSPFGIGPAAQPAYFPKKGTYSLIKETSFTSSLVGWWKFDGNTSDASAIGNNGTANGGTTYENGKFGQAIKFRGEPNNDYVEVPDSNSLDFQSTMSITAWFKKEPPFDATAFLVQKGQSSGGNSSYEFGFPFSGAGNERIRFRLRSGLVWISSPASAAVSDTNWHFAAGTYDGKNLCVWLDTNKQCATSSGVTINLTSRPLTIGAASTFTAGDPIGVLNGQIDNVKIYKTGLTDAEVARDRDNGP